MSSPFDALVQARRSPATVSETSQTSRLSDVQPFEHSTGETAGRAKSADPDFLKFTTYIRRHTHRAVKMKMVEQGREFSDLVEELLSDWLQRQQKNVG